MNSDSEEMVRWQGENVDTTGGAPSDVWRILCIRVCLDEGVFPKLVRVYTTIRFAVYDIIDAGIFPSALLALI